MRRHALPLALQKHYLPDLAREQYAVRPVWKVKFLCTALVHLETIGNNRSQGLCAPNVPCKCAVHTCFFPYWLWEHFKIWLLQIISFLSFYSKSIFYSFKSWRNSETKPRSIWYKGDDPTFIWAKARPRLLYSCIVFPDEIVRSIVLLQNQPTFTTVIIAWANSHGKIWRTLNKKS